MLDSPNITERWKIVIKLLSSPLLAKIQKQALLDDMIVRDSSDTMKNKKYTCDSLMLEGELEVHRHFIRHTEE